MKLTRFEDLECWQEARSLVRQVCRTQVACEPAPSLTEGRWVRVIRGPLTGVTGRLIEAKGQSRLLVSLDLLQQAVAVEVDPDSVVAFDG